MLPLPQLELLVRLERTRSSASVADGEPELAQRKRSRGGGRCVRMRFGFRQGPGDADICWQPVNFQPTNFQQDNNASMFLWMLSLTEHSESIHKPGYMAVLLAPDNTAVTALLQNLGGYYWWSFRT
eukprot:gene22605-29746_t